ncbi:hypothetical protein NW752_006742 [Fusarium irregulare]|uniref:Uncharacterized protein n=1 Tax=Fusarium irregulare TaxID=2494466 RepID=A0A9W8PST0_9HYPO|nr:hypothetical protein NW766_005622 [Fusarium irregulare]KAJ4015818.1 hypothetical protein NW752_006742 [Fusarium irregulare]
MSFYDYYDDSQESNEYYTSTFSKVSSRTEWGGWTGEYSSLTPTPYSIEASRAYFTESVVSSAETLPYPAADNSAYYAETKSMTYISTSLDETSGLYEYYEDPTATNLFTSHDDYYAYEEQGVNTDFSHPDDNSAPSDDTYVSQATQTCELPTRCPEKSQSSNKHCSDEPLRSDKRRSDTADRPSRPSSSPLFSEKPAKSLKTTTQNWVNKRSPKLAKHLKKAQVSTHDWVDKQKETTQIWVDKKKETTRELVDKQKKDVLMVGRLLGKDYRLKLNSQSSQKMAKGFSSVCP